jgi:hypothetical protein
MPSPICTVADPTSPVSTTNGVDVTNNGGVVTIQLTDLSADTWSIAIVGQDDAVAAPTLTTNYVTKTCTFTKPSGPWALLFQSQVSGGVDVNGDTQQSYTTTFAIFCDTTNYSLRLMASNERGEGSALFGWSTKVNALTKKVDSLSGGGGGQPNWQHATGAAPAITIPASTASHTMEGVYASSMTSAGTVTAPASPTTAQAPVTIVDVDGTAITYGLTFQGNGNNVLGPDNTSATTYVFKGTTGYAAGASITLDWIPVLAKWKVRG